MLEVQFSSWPPKSRLPPLKITNKKPCNNINYTCRMQTRGFISQQNSLWEGHWIWQISIRKGQNNSPIQQLKSNLTEPKLVSVWNMLDTVPHLLETDCFEDTHMILHTDRHMWTRNSCLEANCLSPAYSLTAPSHGTQTYQTTRLTAVVIL